MEQNIIRQVVSKFGVPNQLDMVIEECAELIQAINKARRVGIVDQHTIHPPAWESSMTQIEAYNNLCAEVADMKIMLEQIEYMLDSERINLSYDRKLKRLEKKL
jgi:NTP pyrophosphatase (non-canonical NTP hydrolase)